AARYSLTVGRRLPNGLSRCERAAPYGERVAADLSPCAISHVVSRGGQQPATPSNGVPAGPKRHQVPLVAKSERQGVEALCSPCDFTNTTQVAAPTQRVATPHPGESPFTRRPGKAGATRARPNPPVTQLRIGTEGHPPPQPAKSTPAGAPATRDQPPCGVP